MDVVLKSNVMIVRSSVQWRWRTVTSWIMATFANRGANLSSIDSLHLTSAIMF